MKNNTNQIMKLNIPIWIKYWLSKHKNASYILSEILTGTEFFLQDSAPKKFKIFDIIGRTTQESTTGKNLWNGDNIYLNQTYTQNSSIRLGYFEGEAGTYTISLTEKLPNESYLYVGANGSIVPRMDKKATFTLAESGRYVVCIVIRAGTYTNFVSNIQIEQGSTATDYEPYTGGEPAPNPIYPYAIKNTGDNGSVNEKIQNENLFDKDNPNLLNAYFTGGNGVITENSANRIFYLKCKANTSYTITKAKTNYFTLGNTSVLPANGIEVTNRNINAPTGNYDGTNVTFTYTTDLTAQYIVCRFYQTSVDTAISLEDVLASIQLEEGSTATSYVPHSEQNISFPLAQGQKLYQDEELKENGKDDIWGEKILNGTEDWQYVNGQFVIYGTNYLKYSDGGKCYSSHFIGSAIDNLINVNLHMWIGNNTFILCQYDDITSLEDWKTFLAEQYANGTPVTVVYKKAEPTITPYTEGQQQYYDEHIKPLRTYKNITHISSEDETPANLRIQYYKEG